MYQSVGRWGQIDSIKTNRDRWADRDKLERSTLGGKADVGLANKRLGGYVAFHGRQKTLLIWKTLARLSALFL